jgi:hypothetical protein
MAFNPITDFKKYHFFSSIIVNHLSSFVAIRHAQGDIEDLAI